MNVYLCFLCIDVKIFRLPELVGYFDTQDFMNLFCDCLALLLGELAPQRFRPPVRILDLTNL